MNNKDCPQTGIPDWCPLPDAINYDLQLGIKHNVTT